MEINTFEQTMAKRRIKRDIRKYLKTTEKENKTYPNMECCKSSIERKDNSKKTFFEKKHLRSPDFIPFEARKSIN